MPHLSRIDLAYREFESELDNLLELEAHIAELRNGVWKGKRWKVNWYAIMLSVSAYSAWERLVEKLVIALLSGDTSKLASELKLALPQKVSLQISEALLTDPGGYIIFGKPSDLIGRTRKWLSHNPFEKLTTSQKELLDHLRVIRNAVVHGSRKSDNDLKRRLGKKATPISVLMKKTGGQTTLRKYLEDLKQIPTTLQTP